MRKIFLTLTFLHLLLIWQNMGAEALTLTVGSASAYAGESIDVNITAGGYAQEQIAGAVFTLTYSTDHLTLIGVDSNFFDTFLNQWNSLIPVPNPLPPTSATLNSQTYNQPLLFNTVVGSPLGKSRLAAVRVKAGTPTTIFTLHFTVSNTAPLGEYPISIIPTIISNVNAGYVPEGEPISMLIDSVAGETDPALAYLEYSPTIINGKILVQTILPDSDNDGIPDNIDNCVNDYNPEQGNIDNDIIGDACDEIINGPLSLIDTKIFSSTGTVTTDGTVIIEAPANVVLHSNKLILKPGFHATKDCTLHVIAQ